MIYDLAIVGGGPAGLSAAVTAKNRNLSTVLFDPGSFGLALQKASHITNYLGFPDISGKALMQAFLDHAKKAGTEIVSEKILSIMNLDGHFYLATPSGVTEDCYPRLGHSPFSPAYGRSRPCGDRNQLLRDLRRELLSEPSHWRHLYRSCPVARSGIFGRSCKSGDSLCDV